VTPDPDVAEKLPAGVQVAINAGVLLATVIASIIAAIRRPREEEPSLQKTDMLVTAATLADTKPLREAVDELRRLASAHLEANAVARDLLQTLRDIRETMQASAVEERVEREVHTRMAAVIAKYPAEGHK
jgi:hypothetical protein